jgi:hypothetical protein
MNRLASISVLYVFLIFIISPSIAEPLLRTVRILQDDNNATNTTNATVPDEATADTNVTAPTAAPQQVTPDVTPAPTPVTTHEPKKKYEPKYDDEKEEEGKKHSAFAVFGSIVLIILGLGILCYFRDAITFFVGSVRTVYCIFEVKYYQSQWCVLSLSRYASIQIVTAARVVYQRVFHASLVLRLDIMLVVIIWIRSFLR